jgi:hypothetical protein
MAAGAQAPLRISANRGAWTELCYRSAAACQRDADQPRIGEPRCGAQGVKDVGCWDHEREVAKYVAALHRAAVATHARITLHPKAITINHAEAVEKAATPFAYKENVPNANLLAGQADRHDDIARANAWCHRLTVHNGDSHATCHQ